MSTRLGILLPMITSLSLAWGACGYAEAGAAEGEPAHTDRQGDPLPRGAVARLGTLRFRHAGEVGYLAYSPDGTIVASSGRLHGETLVLWDAATGKDLHRFPAPKPYGTWCPAAFSSEGRLVAAERDDQTISLWDVATGKEVRRFTGHDRTVVALAISRDGKTLTAAGWCSPVFVWDLATAKLLRQFPLPSSQSSATIAIAPDGSTIASTGADGRMGVYDLATGKRLWLAPAGAGDCGVAFSRDSKLVACTSRSTTEPKCLLVRETRTGKRVACWAVPDQGGCHLVFSPDGKFLATAGHGSHTCLWVVATGKRARQLGFHLPTAASLAFSPNGLTLAATSGDHQVHFWDVASGQERGPWQGPSRGVPLSLSPDGRTVATGGQTIQLWNAATGQATTRLEGPPGGEYGVAFAADGSLATGGADGVVRLWDIASRKELRQLKGHDGSILALTAGADGTTLASAGSDCTIRLWEETADREVRCLKTARAQRALALAGSAGTMAGADPEASVFHLWNVAAGKEVARIDQRVWAMTMAADGRTLIAGHYDEPAVGVWEAVTGKLRRRFPMAAPATSVALSLDGKRLAVGTVDGTIRLLEMPSGKERLRLAGHQGQVHALAFARDGNRLASASHDTTALIWDLAEQAAAKQPPVADLTPQQVEHYWTALAGDDAARAYDAMVALAAAPKQALPLLGRQVLPVPALDRQQLRRLAAELDSERYAVRQAAMQALLEQEQSAAPLLRDVLAAKPSLEVVRRVESLLAKLEKPLPSAERLQGLRAVEVLELIGIAAARQHLEALARGAPEVRLTQEARASLRRMSKRKRNP